MNRTVLRHGQPIRVDAEPGATLLQVLRGPLGATEVRRGCDDGRCGACRVLLGGELVASCRVRWGDVDDGAPLETPADVLEDATPQAAVAAFERERPTRCRLCVPALGITAAALARPRPPLSRSSPEEAVEVAMAGLACSCTGRGSLRRALVAALRGPPP